MAKEKLQITNWLSKDEYTPSKNGRVTNHEWLQKEQIRIMNSSGRSCEIKTAGNDEALFYVAKN